MTTNRRNLVKLAGICLVLAAALFFTFGTPKRVSAAKKFTYGFEKTRVTKVKVTKSKVKILGQPFSTADYQYRLNGWDTYKINSKTKFRQLMDTETGKTKKVKKATALKKLKKKKFITIYITFDKKNKASKILFGI